MLPGERRYARVSRVISAFLIVRNEATNLPVCLASLGFADEIVVVDSGSQDETVEVARAFTDRVYHRKFTDFATQKNFALSLVRGDWALSIDADERVPPELRDEILRTVASPVARPAYRIPRKTLFRGQWMRCFWPDYQIRLFRPAAARFVGIVHETVQVTGEVGTLESPLIHDNAPTVGVFLRKTRLYAPLDARRRIERGERTSVAAVVRRCGREFRRLLIDRQGYRDGWNGVLFCGLMAHYVASVGFHWLRATPKSDGSPSTY
jgi:glycosyltransferase involved in cell wall biosynthesis